MKICRNSGYTTLQKQGITLTVSTYNFIKPHEGLNGKTPAEACGIQVNGENKWITLIQNAAQAK